jgi:hypothetical protein
MHYNDYLSLPSRSLPSRSLPCRALTLIREYSKPLTRPDWRKSKSVISQFNIYVFVLNDTNYAGLSYIIYRNIIKTEWYHTYMYIIDFGIDQYYYYFGHRDILYLDGIVDAEWEFQEFNKSD